MKSFLLAFLSTLCYFISNAQCTADQCVPSPTGVTTFTYSPLRFTTANTLITQDNISDNRLLFTAVGTNVGCTAGGVGIDVRVRYYYFNQNAAVPDPTGAQLSVATDPSYQNTLLFAGVNFDYIHAVAEFFQTGTNLTTPVSINTLQQVVDIDGEGDWNGDGTKDDPRVNNFTGNRVADDFVLVDANVPYVLPASTLIYSQSGFLFNGSTTAYRPFFLQGTITLPLGQELVV